MGLRISRRNGEAVTVDGPATIRIIKSGRGHVSLNIDAPAETTILRDELQPKPESNDQVDDELVETS